MHSVHKLLSGLIIKSCAVWSAYQTRLPALAASQEAPRPHASHALALLKPFYTFRPLFLFFCHCCWFVCLLQEQKETERECERALTMTLPSRTALSSHPGCPSVCPVSVCRSVILALPRPLVTYKVKGQMSLKCSCAESQSGRLATHLKHLTQRRIE